MKIGQTIDYIRKQKGMQIKELCQDDMSRQNYTKFVKGEIDTSVSNFFTFLDRLCISFDEFTFLNNSYKIKNLDVLMYQMKQAFESNDVIKLREIILFCNQYETLYYTQLNLVGKILLSRLEKTSYVEYANPLHDYLIKTETWTHYELMLFNNIMFTFSPDALLLLLRKAAFRLEKYRYVKNYGSEVFRMYANAVLFFLEKKQLIHVKEFLIQLNSFPLNDDSLYEKNILLFLNGIFEAIENNAKENKKINNSLKIFKILNSEDSFVLFETYKNEILKIYERKCHDV